MSNLIIESIKKQQERDESSVATENLTEGSVFRSLLKYAAPMIVTSILQAVYSIVDIWIAGIYIGGSGISGISNGSLIMNLITQIAIGITVGGNVLISQYFGSGMETDRRKAVGTLLVSSLIMSVFFGFIFYASARPLLVFLNAPALEEAVVYVQICSMGMLFIFGYNALSAILRAAGNSSAPMYTIALATAVNVVLDYIFIAEMDMGVAGAAIGTATAQGVSFFTALIYTARHGGDYGFDSKELKIYGEKLKKILRLGFPIALQWTIASVSWLAVAFLINLYGVDVSAGNGISNKIKDFCQLFITAMTSAAATMAAQNLGAGKFDRAREVLNSCLKTTIIMAFIIIAIVEAAAPFIVSFFNKDPIICGHAVTNIRIEIIAQIFYAGFLSYNILATACGDTIFVMANSFLNCIVVRLVLAFALESVMGIMGVYLACMIAPASSVPVGWYYCKKEKWKKRLV